MTAAPGEGDSVQPDVENVFGGNGNDSITGNAAANLISGGGGNDTIAAGDGDDKLIGGGGNDTLLGQGGINLFSMSDGVRTTSTPPSATAAARQLPPLSPETCRSISASPATTRFNGLAESRREKNLFGYFNRVSRSLIKTRSWLQPAVPISFSALVYPWPERAIHFPNIAAVSKHVDFGDLVLRVL